MESNFLKLNDNYWFVDSQILEKKIKKYPSLNLVVMQGVVYSLLQIILFFLPINPYIDYYNHINWGIGYEEGLFPYRDYSGNEYPVLSAYSWIFSYQLMPRKTYILLSIAMNLPYWILSIFGGITLYKLLIDMELSNRKSIYIVTFFFFLPLNLIDTLNNHGSLGTTSTVIIAIYFWYQNRYFWSSVFIAAGFSLKIYPIFIIPFMIIGIQHFSDQIKYLLYLILWLLFFHIPVLFILDDYFKVLFWRASAHGGITYSRFFEILVSPLGIENIPTILWLVGLLITVLVLIGETKLHMIHKFAIIIMVNNLLEPRGGIGHIVTVLPIIAIYYFVYSNDKKEKNFFWLYILVSIFWGLDRIMFNFKANIIVISTMTILMVVLTTAMFYIYVRGLYTKGYLELNVKKIFSHNSKFIKNN